MPPGAPRAGRWAEKPAEKVDLRVALSKLIRETGSYRWMIYLGVALSIVSAVFALIGPQYLSHMADAVEAGIGGTVDMTEIYNLALILLFLYATSVALAVTEHYIIPRASVLISTQFRSKLMRKLEALPLSYLDSSSTGDLMSRITNDTDTIGDSYGQSLSMFLTSLVMLLGSLVMMVWMNAKLAAYACIPIAIAMILMWIAIRRSQKYFVRQSVNNGAVNGLVEETYYAMDILRAYNGEEQAIDRFDMVNRKLGESAFMSRFISGMMPRMMNFFNNLGYVIVCVMGVLMVVNGEISVGVVVAFIVYVRHFTQPIGQIADSFSMLQSVGASSVRIFEILKLPEMSHDGSRCMHIGRSEGSVEFRDVHFSYNAGAEVIHGFSMKIEPGTKVAIVGPTGAGKTTLANLLMGFYDVDSGSILIDGTPIDKVPRNEIHDQFSMVLQDSWVFRGSVRYNVAYATGEISDERIWEVLASVGIDGFVKKIGGLDAKLEENGSLSAGQKQQIAMARAIIRDSPMVILDEATSSVDTRTEMKILKAMSALMEGKTAFIIAHRLTTIRSADVILVIRDGNIVETGTHDDLMSRNGFYAELYKSQFSNCE